MLNKSTGSSSLSREIRMDKLDSPSPSFVNHDVKGQAWKKVVLWSSCMFR